MCVETIIEEGRRKQAEIKGEAGVELLDDLPWGETSLVGVGARQVEVELIEGSLGHELGAAAEGFQVEELILDEAVDGFDVALVGVGAGRDAVVLGAVVGDGGGEVGAGAVGLQFPDKLAAVIGLPSEVAERDAATREVRLDALSEQGAGGGRAAKARNCNPLRTSRAV